MAFSSDFFNILKLTKFLKSCITKLRKCFENEDYEGMENILKEIK